MRLDILTLFPNMMSMFFEESIISRAQKKGLVEVVFHNLHDYSLSRYGSVDDYPYGGGAGMVMAVEPLANCIDELKSQRQYDEIIYTAPDGEMLSQPMANTLSLKQNLMILCGHYKGVDERIREHFITMEISIGDYVLTGGELTSSPPFPTLSRTVLSRRLNTPARPNSEAGVSRTCSSAATMPRLNSGAWSRQ